jgi:hypothetical protein
MANTMTLIASSTVGSGGTANITFSSIASTYTDLILKISAATNRADFDSFQVKFNGSSSSYSSKVLFASSTSVSSFSGGSTYLTQNTANGNNLANVFGSIEMYIPNYLSSTNKSVSIDSVTEGNVANTENALSAALWSDSSAITSISIAPNVGSLLLQYSTAYLYGIKNS